MKWVISRYNHDLSYLPRYTNDFVIYDRSPQPIFNRNVFIVPNIGSDIYDKFTYIIDNYDNLPKVAVYTKANIFKYITEEEFEKVRDNKTFTPLLTKNHIVYEPICRYTKDGLYEEINNFWYLNSHPAKYAKQIIELFGMDRRKNNKFAPGSNYILPKENILKHPKSLYEQLRSYLDWDVYPGDAQLIERNLWYLWQ